MYINCGKKIVIKSCANFSERFKSFKFYLEPIKSGLYFPNKKLASTYFFCQKVDICFTDKDDRIIALYNEVRSEKMIIKFKAKNIYYLPLGSCSLLKVGDILKQKKE